MRAVVVAATIVALALVGVAALAGPAGAQAPGTDTTARWRVLGSEANAGVPFALQLEIQGFEDDPRPVQPPLAIPGAKVAPLAVTGERTIVPRIRNGRRVQEIGVVWLMRWQVTADAPGRLAIPAVTVKQGNRTAAAPAGALTVEAVAEAPDMRVVLDLPTRPVYVGEIVPVTLTWTSRRQPTQNPRFTAPITGLDAFTITSPPTPPNQKGLPILGGQKDVMVPADVDTVTEGGAEAMRVRASFLITPRTAGKIEIPPSTVVAALPVGRQDFFGNAPSRVFRTTDQPRTLEVKALPETGRPPTFAGAIGEQFAIEVRASRSVVKLGEPVELAITIKSDRRLDTLALGRLDGEGRLPKDKFTAPADPPTGELSEDGHTKSFKAVAQVVGPATEIPALVFAYFDPVKGAYQSIQSEPIALSVGGSSVVGAGAVVSGAPSKRAAEPSAEEVASVNAELALSSTGAVDDQPLSGTVLWVLVGLLYAVPLALLAGRTWQLRTASRREEAAEVRTARRRVEELLDRGQTAPARELAGPLAAALRDLARALGRDVDDRGLLARLETESFAPGAADRPLSPDLRSDAAGLLRRWTHAPRRATSTGAVAILIAGAWLAPSRAHADALDDGRAHYQQAMTVNEPSARKAAFARAAVALGEAARAHPERPELLADWGNAALGAGDVATATLAYRRALAIDGGNPRARRNLGWLRTRQSGPFAPTTTAGATDTLLFFHTWPRAHRWLVGAAAFAIAILLLVPWSGRRRRRTAAIAALPAAIWLAMLASVALEDRHEDDAVVMDAVILRAADSAGAPAALTQPVPRGAEVELLERRAEWARIRIANGTEGWVPSGAVEKVR